MRKASKGFSRSAVKHAAFTLVELLAVLTMAAVLTSLALPGLTRTQRQGYLAQCSGNLRQLALMQLTYADENNGRLPSARSGAWPLEISSSYGNTLAEYGAGRWQFHCPATEIIEDYPYSSTLQTGYSFTLSGSTLIASNANLTILPQQSIVGVFVLSPPRASQRVLVADIVISQAGQNSTANKLNYTYTGIDGGFVTRFRTSHMDMVNRYPAGANVVMLDGHAEWRSFSNVICRTQGGTPGFWW